MGAERLSSRAIVGRFYHSLSVAPATAMALRIGRVFTSDQSSEEYAWLGQVPAMAEWRGGRLKSYLRDNGLTIRNVHYEASIAFKRKDMRRDKTGQINARIDDLVKRTQSHWNTLASALVLAGESAVCYDGQYFFDTDHAEGDSGTQSNDISNDITTTTAPTADEMQSSILLATQAILGFKDDVGEPMNENAREFLVMVPVPYLKAAAGALGATVVNQSSNLVQAVGSVGGFSYKLAVNARLSWTTKFAVLRTDGAVAPFIRQEEDAIKMSAIGEGSEEEFKNDRHLYGVKASRNVGYGYWQKACLVTHT